MEHIRFLLSHLWSEDQPRQTSVGSKVPYPNLKDKDEVLANLRYVEAEIQFCKLSIRHTDPPQSHRFTAKLLLKCVNIAQEVVAGQADTEHTLAISEVALAILPIINPYAERYYGIQPGEPDSLKNFRMLAALDDEYMRGFARLGKAVLEADSLPTPLEPPRTFKETYDGLKFSNSLLFRV